MSAEPLAHTDPALADAIASEPVAPSPSAIGHARVMQIALDALLGDAPPRDWHDPGAVLVRTLALEHAAEDAGEQMVELLARLRDERAQGVHPGEAGCVTLLIDGIIALHQALITYQGATVRLDGLDVARRALEAAHGVGVADLTLAALGHLRGTLDQLARERWAQRGEWSLTGRSGARGRP